MDEEGEGDAREEEENVWEEESVREADEIIEEEGGMEKEDVMEGEGRVEARGLEVMDTGEYRYPARFYGPP